MKRKIMIGTIATMLAVPSVSALLPVNAETLVQETQETVVKVDFKDVPKGHYAYKHIMKLYEDQIISGYPDGTFKPSNEITRAHVALMFYNALDLKEVREGKEFKAVPKTHPYYEQIQAVYKAGIFNGKEDGTFGATEPMTRAQMAVTLTNAFDLERHTGYIFKDVSKDHWAKDYIATLYANGISIGSNGEFMPNKSVTRAQFSIFLYNSLFPDEVQKPTVPLQPEPPINEKPQPEPKPKPEPKPSVSADDIPNRDDIVAPPGWTEEKIVEYNAVLENVLENSPVNKGTNGKGWTSLLGNSVYTLEEMLRNDVEGYNSRGANTTYEEYVSAIIQVIEEGTVYVHSSGVYAFYYDYSTKGLVYVVGNNRTD